MQQALLLPMAALALWAATETPLRAEAHASDLEMTPGMVVPFTTVRAFKEIMVGKHEVADVVVTTDRSVAITAKDPGRTTILFVNAEQQAVESLEVDVVPLQRGLGRKIVTVRSFMDGYVTNTYNCETRRERGGGPCVFDKSATSIAPAPAVSAGTSSPAVQKAP